MTMDIKLKQILQKYTPENITDTSDLQLDLNLDSFQVVSIAVDIEDTFQISLPMEEVHDMVTVNDLTNLINEKKK